MPWHPSSLGPACLRPEASCWASNHRHWRSAPVSDTEMIEWFLEKQCWWRFFAAQVAVAVPPVGLKLLFMLSRPGRSGTTKPSTRFSIWILLTLSTPEPRRCTQKWPGNHKHKTISTWNHQGPTGPGRQKDTPRVCLLKPSNRACFTEFPLGGAVVRHPNLNLVNFPGELQQENPLGTLLFAITLQPLAGLLAYADRLGLSWGVFFTFLDQLGHDDFKLKSFCVCSSRSLNEKPIFFPKVRDSGHPVAGHSPLPTNLEGKWIERTRMCNEMKGKWKAVKGIARKRKEEKLRGDSRRKWNDNTEMTQNERVKKENERTSKGKFAEAMQRCTYQDRTLARWLKCAWNIWAETQMWFLQTGNKVNTILPRINSCQCILLKPQPQKQKSWKRNTAVRFVWNKLVACEHMNAPFLHFQVASKSGLEASGCRPAFSTHNGALPESRF